MNRAQRAAPWALIAAGGLLVLFFWPFTLAHGPTSDNEERQVLGLDMLGWGLLLGPGPKLLAATALWTLRDRLGAIGALNRIALGALCASFAFTAALDLLIGGLNAPFELFVAAPAATVLTLRSRAGTGVRATLGGLAVLWWLAVGLVTFVPDARILGTGGYRVFGVVAYVAVGLLWVTLGVVLLRRIPSGR